MWKLSKCVHMAGGGFVSLPEAKVLAANRKLKSSGMYGLGMGERGRMARRKRSAAKPIEQTEKPRLRARRPRTCSIRGKNLRPSWAQRKATATEIKLRPPSI